MNYRFIFLLLILAGLSACIKEPNYPVIPAIEFKSVSSALIKSGSTDTITFSFTDGDGDIGVNASAADSCNQCGLKSGDSSCLKLNGFNVFLIDSRDTCVGTFASPNVQIGNERKAISGEVQVVKAVDSKKCFVTPSPGCPKDTVIYTIYLRDKAGHFSNAIHTVPIVVDGE